MRSWSQRYRLVRWVLGGLQVLRMQVQEILPCLPLVGRFFGKS